HAESSVGTRTASEPAATTERRLTGRSCCVDVSAAVSTEVVVGVSRMVMWGPHRRGLDLQEMWGGRGTRAGLQEGGRSGLSVHAGEGLGSCLAGSRLRCSGAETSLGTPGGGEPLGCEPPA